MKNNQTIIGAGILLVLALIYYVTQTGAIDTKTVDQNKFAVNRESVKAIEVVTTDNKLEFAEGSTGWMLDDYPVDTSRMNSLLEQVTALKVDRMITSNPEKHAKYELISTSPRISLRSDNGTMLLDLLVGKQGANYLETFVREVGVDKVYAVKSNLGSYRNMEPGKYWDRAITDLDVNQIIRVSFAGDLNYELKREGPVWTYNGELTDFEKVTNMLKPLQNLKASNFAEAITEQNIFYQSIQIVLESAEIIDLEFYVDAERETTLLVKVTGGSKTFEYTKSGLNRFRKEYSELIADPIPVG
ncbi:MAG: DUF4340 domain-containing protein [Candidatus Marinimicrobia bacterium]|nr:DUF4340 domain-containing protein [Candidatus Neomarinimicrobiota bacterium]